MAQCPPLSVPSVKASLKESSDMESECTKNLCDKQHLLVMVREEAVKQVYRHQKMIVSLDEEIDNVGRDLVNVHVHYSKERETLLHKAAEGALQTTPVLRLFSAGGGSRPFQVKRLQAFPVLCDLQLMETSPAAVRPSSGLPRVAASTGGPAVTYGAALIGQGCGRQGPSKSSSGVLVLFLAVLSFL
ncbi:hypothetical protein OUZ56_016318 [Daphnia magna]|uniref:Uncharacterized protein n=1 Tax=Daphnia magna TaxID=35525 RepID=A0ABR0AQA2_9CRUS|nr:hypothetical protein OUZ56_016318 [Daphnia magna]